MKITLDHREILEAITQYVATQGIAVTGKSMEITLTAGRGENGHSALVDIISEVDKLNAEKAKKEVEPEIVNKNVEGKEATDNIFDAS